MQYELELIPHKMGDEIISQRAKDGYINASAMCKAALKLPGHYFENDKTKAFLKELSRSIGIPIDLIVMKVVTGANDQRGTWVHPQVAIHLAQWLSPHFAVQVSQWVFDWMTGKAPTASRVLPFHLRRYLANHGNVPVGHFSILTELTQTLIAPMEALGYTLPEHLWPDVSEGKMFCKFLREKLDVDTDDLPTYWHTFEDGRSPVRAKAYPESLLADFRRHFRDEWLPKRAADYFRERDIRALQYLPMLLPPKKRALN